MVVSVLEIVIVCVPETFGLPLCLVRRVHTLKVELTFCDYACLKLS